MCEGLNEWMSAWFNGWASDKNKNNWNGVINGAVMAKQILCIFHIAAEESCIKFINRSGRMNRKKWIDHISGLINFQTIVIDCNCL